MIPCRFFAEGRCARGDACRFIHATPRPPTKEAAAAAIDDQPVILRPEVPAFKPSLDKTPLTTLDRTVTSKQTEIVDQLAEISLTAKPYSIDLNGATVSFGPGAEVAEIQLESDFSTIQISGLPPNARTESLVGFLAGLGFTIAGSSINLKSAGTAASVAEIRVEDPKFAENVMGKFNSVFGKVTQGDLTVKILQTAAGSGGLANRLQMSTVSCTWYKPSRVAWLHYSSYDRAEAAQRAIEQHGTILNRTIECLIQAPRGPPNLRRGRYRSRATAAVISLQVGNLDIRTTEAHFTSTLSGILAPEKIAFGRSSYSYSDAEAGRIVEDKLKQYGDLESFDLISNPASTKMKATATFQDRQKGTEAVQALHNTKLQELGNSRLFISHLISVKYNVLTTIFQAVHSAFDHLREEIWNISHTHLKSYPSNGPLTVVRLFGGDLKQVAQSKGALERILAGSIVMSGDVPLWDTYFSTLASLLPLNQISATNNLYIYRDARKSQLIMYGGTKNEQQRAETLIRKILEEIQTSSHIIVLDSSALKLALQGGWRRIKARFGDAATLNISLSPKTIKIEGSVADFEAANAMLSEGTESSTVAARSDTDCSVCWGEAEQPLKTICGHTYCKDCFQNQCSEGRTPIECLGDEGKCSRIFPIEELKEMVAFSTFEALIRSSFDSYIRTHPATFQYCPTPDCPQIYRFRDEGSIFLCSRCLTSVCTSCKVTAHEGMTCAEFKDLTSEDTKAFQKWKKENDIRPCPRCKTDIEKNDGCNHMACRQCMTHICWFCMQVFHTSNQCYAHMQSVHKTMFA